ncbi:uncharacterized protein UTRI_00605_B [Ustilago trichophora]|uniref:NYN domain-containing protein n=1 Tax=Ustilago trichophora TaxID=86804 RepID=A0A5C3DQ48_9BASI|nr:uncharacterized protein UTRI_00605_B [Ustilago trichophora]
MASNRQDAAASASLSSLAQYFQQPSVRWLALAGLGTGSLLIATQLLPRSSSSKGKSIPDRDEKQRESSPPPTNGKSKRDRLKEDSEPIAIFWDVDNCAPPTGSSGRSVALAVRSAIQNLDVGPIVSFKAYLELSSETQAPNAAQVQLRSELQGCGVSLIDTPKSGRKDVADKMMITDLLAYAIDQPAPATVVLISGDRDFAYPLGILRNRGYNVVLVTPPIGAVPILEASANVVMSWRQDVLGVQTNKDGKSYSSYSSTGPQTPSKHGHHHNTAGNQSSSVPSNNSLSVGKPPGALKHQDRRPSNRTLQLFDPLIQLLEQIKKEGNPKPLRSMVAARLVSLDRSIFVRAGAAKWAEYAAVAEAAGIVKLGSSGQTGYEWVALKDSAKAAASSISMMQSDSSTSSSGTPNRQKPAPYNANATTTSTTTTELPAKLKPFFPLIEICKEQKSQGNPKPLCSFVGMQLSLLARQGVVDAYALAGVPGWREYIAAAEKAGVARSATTDQEGVLVVELHPKYLYAHTGQVTPSAGRIADTATTPTPSVDKKMSAVKRGFLDFSFSKSTPKNESPLKGAGQKRRTIVNGHEIPLIFSPLATLLLEQMAEGRNYSTDYFCHSIIGSQRSSVVVPGLKAKSAEEFQEHLEAAVAAKIVTTEPGFKPGTRHIRLHPRLVRPGSKTNTTDGEDEGSDDGSTHNGQNGQTKSRTKLFSLGKGKDSTSSGKEDPPKAQDLEALRKETSQVLASLQRSTSSEAATSSGPVPADDSIRFRPLIDSLVALNGEGVTKTKLSSEVSKRNPGPGGIGAFYQSLGSTGFTDYLQQAKEKGLVKITDAEGNVLAQSSSLLGLTDYTVSL